jgi:twitching motility protein PilT
MDANPPSGLIGRIGIHLRLITPEQLAEATRFQGRPGNEGKLLGEILVELGYLSREQVQKMLTLQRAATTSPPAPPRKSTTRPRALPSPTTAPQPEIPLDRILALAVRIGASDVHLHPGSLVQIRVAGRLNPVRMPALEPEECRRLVLEHLSDPERQQLLDTGDLDVAFSVPDLGRFRANIYRDRRGFSAVYRPIPPEPPRLEALGLPRVLAKLATYHQGLVLISGPSGCGKSSTLAALVRLINEERHDHVITVEDPIEYLHPSLGCSVNQRQVGRHTGSFATALRAALREDPDVIAIGELRDLETVSLAITAAETGHLVLATLHTGSVVRTINRLIDIFPPSQQPQVRSMVSESIRAVVSQRLVPSADGQTRVPAVETLFMNPAIANLIREEKTHQIRSAMQTGRAHGLCLLDDALLELVQQGRVTKEAARRYAEDPKAFA